MITIPAMWPFPAIEFEENIPALRLIATALTRLSAQNSNAPICKQVENIIADIECECQDDNNDCSIACEIFDYAMRTALDYCAFAPTWAVTHHDVTYDQAASLRPAWAAHIVRSLYEQIGD